MMIFNRSITEIIRERFSCRTFQDNSIAPEILDKLADFIDKNQVGPFGEKHRFKLVATGKDDVDILKGLGTYGFIRGANGYLIGASFPSGKYLEDFGFLMEKYVLAATAYELGSCWLGGSFTRSSFSRKISLQNGEELPAVIALGNIDDVEKAKNGLIRRQVNANERRNWETMFHETNMETPLKRSSSGKYAKLLDMVRIGPSASNKQPWQIVRDGTNWHFFLKRTPGYRDGRVNKTLSISDMQRIDMGIAMCHFQLTAEELGIKGLWVLNKPDIQVEEDRIEYTVTWKSTI